MNIEKIAFRVKAKLSPQPTADDKRASSPLRSFLSVPLTGRGTGSEGRENLSGRRNSRKEFLLDKEMLDKYIFLRRFSRFTLSNDLTMLSPEKQSLSQ